MSKPTIVFVPGFWEGPAVFSSLSSALESSPHNYPTKSLTLASTGQVSPSNVTLQGDVQAIRKQMEPLIDSGKEIILVLHSAAGYLGSNAIEGWVAEKRRAQGQEGGIRKIIFLAAGLLPEGTMHVDPPFMKKDGTGRMYCANTRETLLSDLSDSDAASWLPRLQCQPAEGWNDTVTYGAWKEIPSIYVLAEEDKVLPAAIQEHCAELAGSEVVKVKAGHMLMLTQPEKCAEVILRAAES